MEDPMQPMLLLTSVMRPIGPAYGDAQSVGYELLHAQVTSAQGMFSPRAVHRQFSLDYIAENLENPTTVMHYPSRKELIKELKRGYDYVGISFIMVTYHRMKEISALVRKYSPKSKIVLGGFGTVLPDEALKPYGDYICRGDGVSFMRKLLGQSALKKYKHPVIESRLQVFSRTISYTGMIFAGLGCPNGCDFCSTSHFFGREHIKLLSTGRDIYEVVEKHLAINPDAQFTILDEEFLLDRDRAAEFRECVKAGGKPLSIFVFASIKALSLYKPEELLEMGVDGVWIGYEGERSGYDKRTGKSPEDIFRSLKENGIMILASMIIGFDYQDTPTIKAELERLIAMKPDLCQFMIYNPNLGTPLYNRVKANDLLREEYKKSPSLYWKFASGFKSLLKHPRMTASEIESAQSYCFKTEFKELGPSIYRVVETMLNGYEKHKDSPNPFLRLKAKRYARELTAAYSVFMPGELFGPSLKARKKTLEIKKRLYSVLGSPSFGQRVLSFLAVFAALWTSFKLRFNLFQNPKLIKCSWRFPPEKFNIEWFRQTLEKYRMPEKFNVLVQEYRKKRLVRVSFEGVLDRYKAERMAHDFRSYMQTNKMNVLIDFRKIKEAEKEAVIFFRSSLEEYKNRIRISIPDKLASNSASLLLMAEFFQAMKY